MLWRHGIFLKSARGRCPRKRPGSVMAVTEPSQNPISDGLAILISCHALAQNIRRTSSGSLAIFTAIPHIESPGRRFNFGRGSSTAERKAMTLGCLSGTRESSKILEQLSRQTNLSKDSLHDPRSRNFDLLSNLAAERKLVETPSHVSVPLRRHSPNGGSTHS